jgi:ferric-dicitrate binding protein FerR (iron transport regulator)
MIYDWGRHPEELERLWELPAVEPVRPRWQRIEAIKRSQRRWDIGLGLVLALCFVLTIFGWVKFAGWIF